MSISTTSGAALGRRRRASSALPHALTHVNSGKDFTSHSRLRRPPASSSTMAPRLAGEGPPLKDLGGALAGALGGRRPRQPLACGDRSLRFGVRTLILGGANATPDSFSGDG